MRSVRFAQNGQDPRISLVTTYGNVRNMNVAAIAIQIIGNFLSFVLLLLIVFEDV